MYLFEEALEIPSSEGHRGILGHVERWLGENSVDGRVPIRFAFVELGDRSYHCEMGVMAGPKPHPPQSIFHFVQRQVENTEHFNVVMLVPTGVGASIGGHAGDATPAAALLASVSDTLILHPNVVNASDLIDLPSNSLYVEGSVITRLMMGTAGLQKVRSNRVLVLIERHEDELFNEAAINAVNAARATYGLMCPQVIQLDRAFQMRSLYTASGRAAGEVDRLESLIQALDQHRDEYDAIAMSSIISVPISYHTDYFEKAGSMVNPWGGVEAILTHALSTLYDIPAAHSPMLESQDVLNIDTGIVDPRMAAEIVSVTFLESVLKGLQKSPKIVSGVETLSHPGIITASDIACLVIPDGCVGLPTLAALEQGISVIAVRENANLMRSDLAILPWATGQLHIVENYWEAAGVLAAIKAGIDPDAVRRPLPPTIVQESAIPSPQEKETLIDPFTPF